MLVFFLVLSNPNLTFVQLQPVDIKVRQEIGVDIPIAICMKFEIFSDIYL